MPENTRGIEYMSFHADIKWPEEKIRRQVRRLDVNYLLRTACADDPAAARRLLSDGPDGLYKLYRYYSCRPGEPKMPFRKLYMFVVTWNEQARQDDIYGRPGASFVLCDPPWGADYIAFSRRQLEKALSDPGLGRDPGLDAGTAGNIIHKADGRCEICGRVSNMLGAHDLRPGWEGICLDRHGRVICHVCDGSVLYAVCPECRHEWQLASRKACDDPVRSEKLAPGFGKYIQGGVSGNDRAEFLQQVRLLIKEFG